MNDPRIHLSLAHVGGTEMDYIQDAFVKNRITTGGENVDFFEQDLEHYLSQNSFVSALNSGTSALHLALILLKIQAGDVVICQSMTFSASANPILYQGAIPVFVDSELETWNICPIALEESIIDCLANGKKPKAIIAVHLYGMPYQVEAITAISQKYQIPIIEDSAEALGSSYKEQKCGTLGTIGVLSFNGNKIITTSAGGALVVKDKKAKEEAIFFATQSRDKASHYQHSKIGYNYRMSNICAGIGRAQMKVLDTHVAARRAMHQFYVDLFATINGVTVFKSQNANYFSNYWLSCIIVDPSETNGKSNEDLRLFLESENIESRLLWKPMHLQPIFSTYSFYGSTISENLFKTGLCLPSGSNLTQNDKERLTKAIYKFFF